MKVKYQPIVGGFDVVPTKTTDKGTNTDRDALGRAMATVKPLLDTPNAPCRDDAKALTDAAKRIIVWIETGKEPSTVGQQSSVK
jgi:hypothetical protein